MPFSGLKIEWPAGKACDARDLCLEIEILERRIRRLHRELAAEQFAAARNALAAAKAGNAPAEVTAAMDALRRAYAICKEESAATRGEGFLIPQRAPAVQNAIAFHKDLATIAGMVALLYRTLGQAKEEREWRVAAILDFDKAVEMFAARVGRLCQPAWLHTPAQGRFFKDVEAIDPDFVRERADGSSIPHLSRRGRKYFEAACEEARETFNRAVGSVAFTP